MLVGFYIGSSPGRRGWGSGCCGFFSGVTSFFVSFDGQSELVHSDGSGEEFGWPQLEQRGEFSGECIYCFL